MIKYFRNNTILFALRINSSILIWLKYWFEMGQYLYKQRSSHRRCSVRKGILKNFAKFTGKHQCQSFFFNKVTGLDLQFIKKETLVFSCEFCENWVLLNRAPTSIQLHPSTPSSTQLHPPPPSSTHLHPAHFSLHPALCNTLNNVWTKILDVIGQFPQI